MTTIGASAPARNRLFLGVAIAAALIVFGAQLALLAPRAQIFGDFHAFYCGGAAVLHGADPYAAKSIAACESAKQPLGLYSTTAGLATPVPFPGYVFVLFAPFALFPYVIAAVLWLCLLLGSAFAAAVSLARLTARPLWSVVAVLAVPYAIAILALGEVAPVALAALCMCALAIREERSRRAAAWLCVASILPHVAAPAFVALLIWKRSSRIPVIAAGLALAGIDLLIGGPREAFAYFSAVLPAHAQSEIGYIAQYGLTWILHALGVPDRAALLAGDASYALAVIAGIACAGMLARELRDDALLVTVPCAFAVIGGPFMHYSEITLAFPAAMLLARSVRVPAFAIALVLIAIPWQWIVPEAALALPAAVVAVFAVSLGFLGVKPDAALRAGLGCVLCCAVLLAVAAHFGPQVQQIAATHVDASLAQASWTNYIRTRGASAGIVWWIAKAPTWAGLLVLAGACVYGAVKKDLVPAVRVERSPVGS